MLHRLRGRRPSLPTAISLLALALATTGTAAAVTSTQVSIVDPSAPTHIAKVTAAGALVTSGTVQSAPPANPFDVSTDTTSDGGPSFQLPSTRATLAFTRMQFVNFEDANITVDLFTYGQTNGECTDNADTPVKSVGRWLVPGHDTIEAAFPSGLVLKPFGGDPSWCLGAIAQGGLRNVVLTHYDGFVVAGAFKPPAAAAVRHR
jgi:hypothetical protein